MSGDVLFFRPCEHPAIWGVETWEISNHAVDVSIVDGGRFDGRRLDEVAPGFPLLVKTIRARQMLSVQVHPNERTCRVTGGEPKSEMWCALSDGFVYAGLKPGAGLDDVKAAVAENRLEELLVGHRLEAGDVLYIPGGVVHAIGGDSVLYEVQQSSATTFRLYDWGRTGPDGKPRELHLDAALKAIDCSLPVPTVCKSLKTPYFDFSRRECSGTVELAAGEGYLAVYVACGEAVLDDRKIPAGTSFLMLPGSVVSLSGESFGLFETRVAAIAKSR